MGECIIAHRSVIKNEYQLLADITVSGSAVAQVDISGLSIGKGEEVVLVGLFVRGATASGTLSLFCDDDGALNTTLTSYYFQNVIANSTTVSGSRANASAISFTNQNTRSYFECRIKLANSGYVIYQSKSEEQIGTSNMLLTDYYNTTTFTTSSITQLRISQSAGIGVGSRFQLYKVGA